MPRLAVSVALAARLPRPATACSASCSGPRWFSLEARTQSLVLRDAALVAQGFSEGELCLDELWPLLVFLVLAARVGGDEPRVNLS